MKEKVSHLKRSLHPLPEDIKKALHADRLMDAFRKRPPYQQNDYMADVGSVSKKLQERGGNKSSDSKISCRVAGPGGVLAFFKKVLCRNGHELREFTPES
jgi:hypothetical protein